MKIIATAAELAVMVKALENEGISAEKVAQAIINSKFLCDIKGLQSVCKEDEE